MEQDWERPPHLELQLDELNHLVEPAFPGRKIRDHAILATGLANTNIRFRLEGEEASYVLRLHSRDPRAAEREEEIMSYLANHPSADIPVAPLLYTDSEPERGKHPYSIWRFVEGVLLEELFRTLPAPELVQIAAACGRVLAALAVHRFPFCGRFGAGLEIVEDYGLPSRFVRDFSRRALFEGRAGERLGSHLRDELWRVIDRRSPGLAAIDHRYTLVHGDYKRSNLLMRRCGSTWQVAGILDWEFACAGPPLIDVGLFLRAGSALPDGFREAFAAGYRQAGGELPADWLPLSRLADVVSQLTFLDDPRERPRVFAETLQVVEETLKMLG